MPTKSQEQILEMRASAFEMLAEASKMESELVLATKPHDAGTKAATPEMIALANKADALFQDRRARERYIPDALLGEPGWDILLALFAATARGNVLTSTRACAASQSPMATALRWIAKLEADEFVESAVPTDDARRRDLKLTSKGLETMYDALANLADPTQMGAAQPAASPAPATGKKAWGTPSLNSAVYSAKKAR